MTNRKRKRIHHNKNTVVISTAIQSMIRLTKDTYSRLDVWAQMVEEFGDPFEKGNTF